MAKFNTIHMQEILEPIADFLVWTFDNVLVPLGDLPNTLAILVAFGGIGYWLKLQKDFNAKADREGTTR